MDVARGLEVVLAAAEFLEVVPLFLCGNCTAAAEPARSSYSVSVVGLEVVGCSLSVYVKLNAADLCCALVSEKLCCADAYFLDLSFERNCVVICELQHFIAHELLNRELTLCAVIVIAL